MPDNDPDDLNIENLTETKSQRAPDMQAFEATRFPRRGGTRWPAASGIAAVGSLLLLAIAAWKLASRSTRDLFKSDSVDEPR